MRRKLNTREKIFSLLCNRKRKRWSDGKKELSEAERRPMQEKEWMRFWERMGTGVPDFKDRVVVDYGCGYGYDTLLMLEAGAKHVYCLDVVAERLEDSETLHRSKGFKNTTYIENTDVTALAGKVGAGTVDMVVSRNVMEHVPSPKDTLDSIHAVLKPGGIAYIGASPLYYSPRGSHFGGKCAVPWVHLIFSEKTILNTFKALYDLPEDIERFQDIPGSGVNKMAYRDYETLLESFDWEIAIKYVNRFTRRPLLMKGINILKALLPFKSLKELITVNTYVKLIKD